MQKKVHTNGTRLWLLLAGLLGLAGLAQAATYEARPGGLAAGLAQLRAGDTLVVRGGVYGEGITAQGLASGTSWGNAVTIASAPGETVVLTGGIDLNGYNTPGAAYVIFDGLILDGQGISLLKENVHHIRFQHIEVKNVKRQGPACSLGGPDVCPGWSAIGGGAGAHHIEFLGMSVHDNGLNRLDHGFYVTLPDSVIADSEIYHNSGYGVQVYDSSCHSYGNACADRMVIRGNRIHDNRGDGNVTLNYGNGIEFYGNTVSGHGSAVEVTWGTPEGTRIHDNTITGAITVGADARNTQAWNNSGGAGVTGPVQGPGGSGSPPVPVPAPPRLPAPRNLRVLALP